MNVNPDHNKRTEDTHQIIIHLPCPLDELNEQVNKFARENNSTITSVVVEALDAFLRGRKVSS